MAAFALYCGFLCLPLDRKFHEGKEPSFSRGIIENPHISMNGVEMVIINFQIAILDLQSDL